MGEKGFGWYQTGMPGTERRRYSRAASMNALEAVANRSGPG